MKLRIKKVLLSLGLIILAALCGLIISIYPFSILIALAVLAIFLLLLIYSERALFFLIAYIPFQIALNPAPGIDLASGRLVILVMFVGWVFKSLAKKKLDIVKTNQTWLLLLFLLIAFLSVAVADDVGRALRKILVFITIFPLYFLITAAINNRDKLKRAVWINIIVASFLSLIGLFQFLAQFLLGIKPVMNFWAKIIAPVFYGQSFGAQVIATPSWLVQIGEKTYLRAFSLFPDPHMFSFYLGFIIPLTAAFLFLRPKQKPLLFVIFCLLTVTELLTFSRGGYLGLIAGALILMILIWRFLKKPTKALIGLLVLLGLLSLFIPANPITSRLLSITNLQEGSNIGRIIIFKQALGVIRNHPWLGVGIGNYSAYLEPVASYRTPIYAHNTYLDIASEMGLLALLAWLLLIIFTLVELIKIVSRNKDNLVKATAIGLTSGLVWFSIHGLFETPIFSPTILAMLMIILGLAVSVKRLTPLVKLNKSSGTHFKKTRSPIKSIE